MLRLFKKALFLGVSLITSNPVKQCVLVLCCPLLVVYYCVLRPASFVVNAVYVSEIES